MKHFLMTCGTVSLREGRLLRMSPGSPEHQQPFEQPQGDVHFDLRADQSTPEMLKFISDRTLQLHQETDETVEDQRKRTEEQAQHYIDECLKEGPRGRDKALQYMDELNAFLHQMKPQAYHCGATNMQISIKPYNLRPLSPEQIARKNRIVELNEKLKQVDGIIYDLMHDAGQNALQYRGQKNASMNRRNITPEYNRFLMQFPQAAIQASADPIHQWYAIKSQLQQELAVVKNTYPIQVSVPTNSPAQPDAGLINPPRFAARGFDEKRFNLNGAPGGVGPDGQPRSQELQPDPALQQRIFRLNERWKGAKTEEERETIEGFLMMDGVDVEASDLKKDTIVMVSPEEKGMQFFVGLIKVIKSFMDRLGNKKNTIVEAKIGDKDPSTMTLEERRTETAGNNKKLTDLKEKRGKTDKEMKKTDAKLKDLDKPLEGEAKTKAEKELKDMKEELKKIDEDIRTVEERNKLLADEGTKPAESQELRDTRFKKFAQDLKTYKDKLLGKTDQKSSMFEINTAFRKFNEQEKASAIKLIEEANKELNNAGTKYSINLEDTIRFDDGQAVEKDILTQSQLKDDAVFKDFLVAKEQMKGRLRAALEQVLSQGDVQKNMERLGKSLGMNFSEINWNAKAKEATKEFINFMDAFVENISLEKNGADKYRVSIDALKTARDMNASPMLSAIEIKPADLSEFVGIMNNRGRDVSVKGEKIVSQFMDAQTLLKDWL